MLPPLLERLLSDSLSSELGPHEILEPDGFPLLEHSDYRAEHEQVSRVLVAHSDQRPVKERAPLEGLDKLDLEARSRLYLAWLERLVARGARLSAREGMSGFFGYTAAPSVLASLIEAGVDERVYDASFAFGAGQQYLYYTGQMLTPLVATVSPSAVERHRKYLEWLWSRAESEPSQGRVAELVVQLRKLLEPEFPYLLPGDPWADTARQYIKRSSPAAQASWKQLLAHCAKATGGSPNAKWLKQGQALMQALPETELVAQIEEWWALSNKPKVHPCMESEYDAVDERQRPYGPNADTLRGLCWLAPALGKPSLIRALGKLAIDSYRKIRGLGPRAVKLGNAAVYALGEFDHQSAVAQLAIIKVRVKFGTAQKGIEKVLVKTAARLNVSPRELEEMTVPDYGLDADGGRQETLGEHVVTLKLDAAGPTLEFATLEGKSLKSAPAALKRDHAEALKELKQTHQELSQMLTAQTARIDALYLEGRSWDFDTWKQRYLDHPLVGSIARRLVWRFSSEAGVRSGAWLGGALVAANDAPLSDLTGTQVELWHPIHEDLEVAQAWRRWLTTHQITQPFKQAHREVYLLTDAERRTEVYSNRFAAHVLRQHQLNALASARHWKAALRMMVDDTYPPILRTLPACGLRAEFWVEGAGTEHGEDTTEAGAYLRVVTDQVRFYRLDAAENAAHAGGGGYTTQGQDEAENRPLPLEQIPPLVFSEVLRDVDLFVGVSSVGNDPTWSDGGPQGRFIEYWQHYSFGELTATAQTRRALLEELVPKLKIAKACSFSDRFLVVQGQIRTYKIHLGSSNILMEPNDQYLCIVPKQMVKAPDANVKLPFQGDTLLSVILSKALMLAADSKIKDSTIMSQIRP